jgi:hypothetical protein
MSSEISQQQMKMHILLYLHIADEFCTNCSQSENFLIEPHIIHALKYNFL